MAIHAAPPWSPVAAMPTGLFRAQPGARQGMPRLRTSKVCVVLGTLLLGCCLLFIKDVALGPQGADAHYLHIPPSPADQYTFVPTSITPDQLQQLYPAHLRLRLVQVVHRHGERAPTESHFTTLPQFQTGWPLCFTPAVYDHFFLNDTAAQTSPFRIVHLGDDGLPAPPRPAGTCAYGQLTDKGKRTLFRVGVFLRHLYVDHLRFLPTRWTRGDQLYVRATDIPRTHHSALSLLLGLYPLQKRVKGLEVPEIHTMPPGKEYMYPTNSCPKQKALWDTAVGADQQLSQSIDRLRSDYPVVRQWLDMYPKPQNPKLWGPTAETATLDTFTVMKAHGMALPEGVTGDAMRDLDWVGNRQQYKPFCESPELSKLVSGLLARDLETRIDAVVSGRPGPKMALFSSHDSTVAPLLCALGLYFDHWPPYASTVLLEVLSETQSPEVMYVRLIFNNKPQALPFCKGPRTGYYLCPLADFKAKLAAITLSAAEYATACRTSP